MPAARAKKIGLTTLKVLGGLVAVVAILVGVTVLVLRSDWGGERVRRQVVSRVNKQIKGTLEIQRLAFGGDKLAVWGVVLRDPEGQAVAQVSRVEVGFRLMRLLHKELRVTAVTIDTPVLGLVSDESNDDGSNLARATAPREKTKPKPKEPPKKTTEEGWVVVLDRFDLSRGDLSTATATAEGRETRVHLSALAVFASVRYATGNGSLDLALRVSAQSERVPVGPLRLSADVHTRGTLVRFDADGDLLGGSLKAHGSVNGAGAGVPLASADGSILLTVPKQTLAGYEWGPLRIDARAHPGTAPKLDLVLALPGLQLTANDRGQEILGVLAKLSVADLALTRRAVQALSGGELAPLAGKGELELVLAQAPAGFDGRVKGAFETLRFGETVLTGLSLAASAHQRDVAATLGLEGPARIELSLGGSVDEDRKGFSLASLDLAFPGARWKSQGTAHLRSDEHGMSLSSFRLASDGQTLAVDASRHDEDLAAHLAVNALQLGKLPTSLFAPTLRLDGALDVDVKAEGKADAPKVVARAELRDGRVEGFSELGAKLVAKLEDSQLSATLNAEAPFMKANLELATSTDALEPGTPIDLKLDVKHLDVGQVLRAAEKPPRGDGRLNLKLRVDGSADAPKVDLAVEAFDLSVSPPPPKAEVKAEVKAAKKAAMADPKSVDLGKARVHVTYAERAARAEVDFKSAHGGTLLVDAATTVDLSYPKVTRKPIVAAKLPIRGKVVAKNLDVAWIAQLSPRVESMGGKVNADARLDGTVGDPQVVGDVRWKNGEVVATTPPPKTAGAAKAPAPPAKR